MPATTIATLQALAADFAPRSYAPYSENRAACIALLSDGAFVPGVRVENASFPLLISATLNALTTALAEGRKDFVAFVSSRPITHVERDLIEPFLPGAWVEDNVAIRTERRLPEIADVLDAVHKFASLDHSPGRFTGHFADAPMNHSAGIAEARNAASSAWVPESDFPVGCILGSAERGYVNGVNVEHPDWNLGLCAERNAVGTAVTYGLDGATTMYLTCLKDPFGTPCGACRQVLVEFGRTLDLVMDRAGHPPEKSTPTMLLPDSFDGQTLAK